MQQYDLKMFVNKQKTKEKIGVLDFGNGNKFKVKASAWSYIKLLTIHEQNKNDSEKLGKEIVSQFLGKEALKFIEQNVDNDGIMQTVSIIVAHITNLTPKMQAKINGDKEKK